MKRELRDEWVRRLRSGQYKQGRSRFRSTDDTFCCLGVLADVLVDEGLGTWGDRRLGRVPFVATGNSEPNSWSECIGTYTPALAQQIGLVGRTYQTGVQRTLTDLNDSVQASFDEIANVIEREVVVDD